MSQHYTDPCSLLRVPLCCTSLRSPLIISCSVHIVGSVNSVITIPGNVLFGLIDIRQRVPETNVIGR
jgi:hypothetical protein